MILAHRPSPCGSWWGGECNFLVNPMRGAASHQPGPPPMVFDVSPLFVRPPSNSAMPWLRLYHRLLEQRCANYVFLFVNIVSLEHSQYVTIYIRTYFTIRSIAPWRKYYPCLLLCYNGKTEQSQQRLVGQKITKIFIIWSFQQKCTDPCPRKNK